jgi:ABC-type multidrug transport system fused ATPase/permease subunit
VLGGVALAVVVLTPIAAHELVAGLGSSGQQLPRLRSAAGRVAQILARRDPVHEPDLPLPMPPGPYGLRLRGVAARYPAGRVDVLRDLNLDLRPGERALVTGASGSGKSTLAALLLRFLDPSCGSIELVTSNGPVALTALAGDDVRQVIGLCAQEPHIFDTSLRENLRLARPDAGDPELLEALGSAGLGRWVDSLPDGLDTLVGAHGARVSGGQRQRLELARALLGDRPLLVLAEPPSSSPTGRP